MKCKLCNNKCPLIEAHVLPRSYYKKLKGKQKNQIQIFGGDFPKKTNTGVYDNKILCADCDNYIGKWDDYAFDFFTCTKNITKHSLDGFYYYELKNYDYDSLFLFILSFFWRASISSREEFKYINMKKFNGLARNILLNKIIPKYTPFKIIISKYTPVKNHPNIEQTIIMPKKRKLDKIFCYESSFIGFSFVLKVDRNSLPYPLDDFTLSKNRTIILEQNYTQNIQRLKSMVTKYNLLKK